MNRNIGLLRKLSPILNHLSTDLNTSGVSSVFRGYVTTCLCYRGMWVDRRGVDLGGDGVEGVV